MPELIGPGEYIEETPAGARTIIGVPTAVTAFVGRAARGPTDTPVVVNSFAEFEQVFGGLGSRGTVGLAVRDFFLNGGSTALVVRLLRGPEPDGLALTDSEFVGAGLVDERRGLYALDRADLFNLLVIPPYRDDGAVDPTVISAAAEYCERRRSMLLLDGPPAWRGVADIPGTGSGLEDVLGTTSPNAALFFPRLREPDPLAGGRVETSAAAGAVAGVIARTDAQLGVWKAAAGVGATLSGVEALAVPLTDADNGVLNARGVNCLRTFPGVGPVVWGSRTLQGADGLGSEWKYIPVRRTALFLEESLSRGLGWAVFEPNDERLWSMVRVAAGSFLHDLFRRGAFRGATPREAYFVRCDRETTTGTDTDRGLLNLMVGFAPLKPGEFVVLRVQLAVTQ